MVFSTTTLFKGVPCPEGEECALTNCIYAHGTKPQDAQPAAQPKKAENTPEPNGDEPAEPATKRRKITYDTLADKPLSRAEQIRNDLAAARGKPPETSQQESARMSQPSTTSSKPPPSLSKSVSPPPANGKATSPAGTGPGTPAITNKNPKANTADQGKQSKVESLNPRLIPNDPAGHQKRSLFIKHLHGEMARLNQQVNNPQNLEFKHLLVLTEQQLIRLALDDEEKMARDHPTLYGNVLKSRVAALKKMPQDEWIKYVKSTFERNQPAPPAKKEEKTINTGLALEHEHLILPQLVADQKPLAAFGYIPTPPTEAEAAEAAAAVEASHNYEICDRCSGRFQVFPDRNEQGLLTSHGPCTFHLLRKVFPQKSKTDKVTGEKQPYYPCCTEPMGTPGCTTRDEHVFKTSSPARLAAILPFISTPENPTPAKDRRGKIVNAVTFDCEMGYTACGLELIRLTAVSWPTGEELLDILVRPLGAIIDFNSRFSGVFPETFANAIPYNEWRASPPPPPSDTTEGPRLPIVNSPQRARELLCSFLTPKTPLIGHAIDNDLNTVRLCHPTIIDTLILYPHPRGLPMRFGLKMLTKRHLNRDIQTGGDRGHDSKEDAVATGDLVRAKVGEKWRQLNRTGWQILNEQLIPPPPLKQSVIDTQTATIEDNAKALAERAIQGKKRKKRPSTDGADDSEEGEDAGSPGSGEGGASALTA